MRWAWTICVLIGLALAAVGSVWFLQGSDLVHIRPILCATDCAPVVGRQPTWQVAGASAVLLGILTATLAVRKLLR